MKKILALVFALFAVIAPAFASASVLMYSQTDDTGSFSTNNNATPPANWCWRIDTVEAATPATLAIVASQTRGSPVYNVSIHSACTAASASYGSASGVAVANGTTTISLSSVSAMATGTYWVYLSRTTNTTGGTNDNHLDFTDFPTGAEDLKYSTASNIDPNADFGAVGVVSVLLGADPVVPPSAPNRIFSAPTNLATDAMASASDTLGNAGLLGVVGVVIALPVVFGLIEELKKLFPGHEKKKSGLTIDERGRRLFAYKARRRYLDDTDDRRSRGDFLHEGK